MSEVLTIESGLRDGSLVEITGDAYAVGFKTPVYASTDLLVQATNMSMEDLDDTNEEQADLRLQEFLQTCFIRTLNHALSSRADERSLPSDPARFTYEPTWGDTRSSVEVHLLGNEVDNPYVMIISNEP